MRKERVEGREANAEEEEEEGGEDNEGERKGGGGGDGGRKKEELKNKWRKEGEISMEKGAGRVPIYETSTCTVRLYYEHNKYRNPKP